jgi:hypothetical protein
MQEYELVISGIKHTVQLSDTDAKERGLDPAKDAVRRVDVVDSPLVPVTETSTETGADGTKSAAAPKNKAATAADAK